MASGTAFRWKEPARDVLNLYPNESPQKTKTKLYEAPSSQMMSNSPPSTPLLGDLPPELIHQVLLILDLTSLGMLRRVNTTTRRLVESLPEYFLLRKHASYTLRVMNATKCTSYFQIRWLFQELCHSRCRTCSDFGPFLYLPTITRSCLKCSLSRPEYQVAPTPDVMFHFGISQKDLKSIPIIYPLPGEWVQKRMVDVAQARALGLRIHGSLEKMKQGFQTRLQKFREKKELAWSKWDEDVNRGSQRQAPRYRIIPMSLTKGFDAPEWRLMGTTWFPYWDRPKRVLEPGVYCQACTYRYEEKNNGLRGKCRNWKSQPQSKKDYDRAFLQAELPEHFLHCPAVKANYNFQDKTDTMIRWPFRRFGTTFTVDSNGAAVPKKREKKTTKRNFSDKNEQNKPERQKRKKIENKSAESKAKKTEAPSKVVVGEAGK